MMGARGHLKVPQAGRVIIQNGVEIGAGTTIDRQCASGLQAIAVAARSVIHDGVEVAIGGDRYRLPATVKGKASR